MRTYSLFVGDKYGLRDSYTVIHTAPMPPMAKGYSGPTGVKALPDPEFVQELIERRSKLKISASRLSVSAGYSTAYVSYIENGKRYPSDEAKEAIRQTLDFLEGKK